MEVYIKWTHLMYIEGTSRHTYESLNIEGL